jgi:hypothetical protein
MGKPTKKSRVEMPPPPASTPEEPAPGATSSTTTSQPLQNAANSLPGEDLGSEPGDVPENVYDNDEILRFQEPLTQHDLMKLIDDDPHCIAWLTESMDLFDWTAKTVPGSTTEFLVATTPKAQSHTYIGSDGFSIFTVYGRISVMDLHFLGIFRKQKGKARRATSTGRTQGE